MANKLIFLSHIHEEKALALLIQAALEDEFSGFVDVFVSSDGTSIPAGANFLKRIEDGLVACNAAIFLISPASVKRQWINFELGAVWIRNSISIRAGGVEIPALPMCHSGATPAALPAPLNNLNAILGAQASQLEFAFKSIQSVVGGGGRLKTDFDGLALAVAKFEREYTLGANIAVLIALLKYDKADLLKHCKAAADRPTMNFSATLKSASVEVLQKLEANELNGVISVEIGNGGIHMGAEGTYNFSEVVVTMDPKLIVQFGHLLK